LTAVAWLWGVSFGVAGAIAGLGVTYLRAHLAVRGRSGWALCAYPIGTAVPALGVLAGARISGQAAAISLAALLLTRTLCLKWFGSRP